MLLLTCRRGGDTKKDGVESAIATPLKPHHIL
jgi:hypothetical protein